MHLSAKDPIISSIIDWIETNEIDLQPEFQRGLVWGREKQQLLIDTILRRWEIPPVFVICDKNTYRKEVLDGQQRLRSIYDFYRGEFPVNGQIQPYNNSLVGLHGLRYNQMPIEVQRKFRNFSIRIFEITDYEKDEPFELFYRLNQSVKLTSAERRNTFHGETRSQVKKIVDYMESVGVNRELIGFNNSRLSYQDVVARLCYALETERIDSKITDRDITNRYRSDIGFSEIICNRTQISIFVLKEAISRSEQKFKLSKPTLFSWLLFITQLNDDVDIGLICQFIDYFRLLVSSADEVTNTLKHDQFIEQWIVKEYDYRSSTSVNDAKSIVFRHFALAFLWSRRNGSRGLNENLGKKISLVKDVIRGDFTEEFVYLTLGEVALGEIA